MELEAATSPSEPAQNFRFTGSGGEYFRIWAVNMLLTVLTVGIYSAWAKVRRLKYFYQHTELADSRFDYHGKPLSILKGRLIALVLLLAYHFSLDISLSAYFLTLGVIALLLPWLLRNSFRFRLQNSSYRGLRFSFHGSNAQAYTMFLLWGVLAFISAYLLAPVFHQRLKQYQHGQSRFGQTPFSFHARVGQFFSIYGLVSLLFVGAVVAVGLAVWAGFVTLPTITKGAPPDPKAIGRLVFVPLAIILFLTLLIGPLFAALVGNLIWNNTRLGEHRFESRLRAGPLLWIGISNLVLVFLTLGLFMPWAVVRVARYRAESTSLLPASELDTFLADQTQAVSATGEETAELFDFDIGL